MEEYAKICRLLQEKHDEQNKVIRDNQEKFSSSMKQIQKQMEDLER